MQGDIYSEESLKHLYRNYLSKSHAVRFIYKDIILPNIEFKLASTNLHKYAIENSISVFVNREYTLKISP